jgi:hypothetical protein
MHGQARTESVQVLRQPLPATSGVDAIFVNTSAFVGTYLVGLPTTGLLDNFGCRTEESVEWTFAYARGRLVNKDWLQNLGPLAGLPEPTR